jgi:hypothetical protein
VGDEGFTHKCLDKFADFKRRGKTILLVTHSLNLVERLCDQAAWLDNGRVRAAGDPKRVIDAYMSDVAKGEETFLASADGRVRQEVEAVAPAGPPPAPPAVDVEAPADAQTVEGRWGSREVEISDVALLDAAGQPSHVFLSGAPMTVRLTVRAHRPVEDFVFGVGIFSADGVAVYGTNTQIEEFEPARLSGDAEVSLAFDALHLTEGTYKLDVAVHTRDGVPYDYHRLLHTFRVKSRTKDAGVYRPPHRWAFRGDVSFTRTP